MEYVDTDRLIRTLARQTARDGFPSGLSRAALPLAAFAALVLALALALTLFGATDGLARTYSDSWFYHKLACMAAVAVGAWFSLRLLARPGRIWGRTVAVAFLPGLAALVLGAFVDASGLGLGGKGAYSVPSCVGAIVLLALPGLAVILLTLRTYAAVTRPMLAGTMAGLLAGALGGAAYALACRNDGGLFVAVWYGAAVIAVGGAGGLLGKRYLAW